VPADYFKGLSYSERNNAAAIADGANKVLKRSSEQMMLGAYHFKLVAGGAVSSAYGSKILSSNQIDVIEARHKVPNSLLFFSLT